MSAIRMSDMWCQNVGHTESVGIIIYIYRTFQPVLHTENVARGAN